MSLNARHMYYPLVLGELKATGSEFPPNGLDCD